MLGSPRQHLDRTEEEPSTVVGSAPVRIVFHDSTGSEHFGTVVVIGLSKEALSTFNRLSPGHPQWVELFPIYTGKTNLEGDDQPAVLGRYAIEGASIRFTPRFPFVAGLSYRSRFDGGVFDELSGHRLGTPTVELSFTMPEPIGHATTYVENVYPTATELPENLLRVYVHFSAPMRTKDVHQHVRLYDSSGQEVPLPFVEIEHGLWDPMNRRLTLFFHPGRIKRGVAPNLELGPPLRQGEIFRLVIDPELTDARGYPLREGFEKEIRVGPADRESPNQRDWLISAPESPDASLVLDFPEPLDHALLQRLIVVEDLAGNGIAGRVSVSRNETRWTFLPETPWRPGEHRIHVNPALEDVAGNTFTYLFDEEMSERLVEAAEAPQTVEIPFRVRQ